MNQQAQKYPKRSDTLALIKAREQKEQRPGAAVRPQEIIALCMAFCGPR